jgi:hypothetical protein
MPPASEEAENSRDQTNVKLGNDASVIHKQSLSTSISDNRSLWTRAEVVRIITARPGQWQYGVRWSFHNNTE